MSLQVEIEPLTPVVLKNLSTETSQNNKSEWATVQMEISSLNNSMWQAIGLTVFLSDGR